MLCNVAQLHWQSSDGLDSGIAVRDEAAVRQALEKAINEAKATERVFRGESWSNLAAMYLDILEAARCLALRECDVRDVEARTKQEIHRLATNCPESICIADSLLCCSNVLQARLHSMA